MSELFLDILTFAVAAGTYLIYIHAVKVKEAKRRESEDRVLRTLERKFSLTLEKKLEEK